MDLKESALVFVSKMVKSFIYLLGRRKGDLISAHLSERLVPAVSIPTSVGVIKFFCPAPLPEWRARSLLSKEPETLQWIDEFQEGDVLWDIGANVGVYSLTRLFAI